MKNHAEIRAELDQHLAAIETLTKEIRCSNSYLPDAREFDAVAREVQSHVDAIKNLAYELGRMGFPKAVRS